VAGDLIAGTLFSLFGVAYDIIMGNVFYVACDMTIHYDCREPCSFTFACDLIMQYDRGEWACLEQLGRPAPNA